jgi:multidrug resistance efflux pump
MTAPLKFAASIFVLAPLAASAAVFSGEVRVSDSQAIFTPPSNSSPVVLRYYVAEGTLVKPGDVLLRIDAGQVAAQVRKYEEQIEQAKPKIAKEADALELKAMDAQIAAIDAQAALDTAKVDAALPKSIIAALDYDRYHAEFDRSTRDAALKQQQLADARAAVERRRADGALELQKLEEQRTFTAAEVAAAEVRAERSGIVVHGFSSFFFGGNDAGRFEEGSSSYPGNEVGEVVGNGPKSVRAYVLESDRADLAVGQKVQLAFDALPGRIGAGTIKTIVGASGPKPEWGSGRYFTTEITLDDATAALTLRPGMSVRVATMDVAGERRESVADRSRGDKIEASGEVYARVTAAISPPAIDDLWQLSVTQMVGDGAPVKKGERIVAFDGGDVPKTLSKKQSELQEKLRTQEKLRLELAEKARQETLAVAEAHADAVKAERKANQPEAYVPGVDYKKLVIARRKAEQHEAASHEHERLAADERAAEQLLADADVARLRADVARLSASLAQLSIAAPRDGIFLHATSWRGEKIDVGSQVWRGMAVGEIPDTGSLAIRATLAERDMQRVARGDSVRIVIEGGSGQTLAGHVEDVGNSVHSKSRVEPIPVVDVTIAVDPVGVKLKPGQPVRIEFLQNEKKEI